MANTDITKDQIEFVITDFSECFQQLRHYDNQILTIFKFLFSTFTIIIGASLGLYQFGLKEKIDLSFPLIIILSFCFIVGIFILIMIIKNRIYYVKTARYLNQIRKYYFTQDFYPENLKRFYSDPAKPKNFDLASSQLLLIYFVSLVNSALLFGILFKMTSFLWIVILVSGLILVSQIMVTILLLSKMEKNE